MSDLFIENNTILVHTKNIEALQTITRKVAPLARLITPRPRLQLSTGEQTIVVRERAPANNTRSRAGRRGQILPQKRKTNSTNVTGKKAGRPQKKSSGLLSDGDSSNSSSPKETPRKRHNKLALGGSRCRGCGKTFPTDGALGIHLEKVKCCKLLAFCEIIEAK